MVGTKGAYSKGYSMGLSSIKPRNSALNARYGSYVYLIFFSCVELLVVRIIQDVAGKAAKN